MKKWTLHSDPGMGVGYVRGPEVDKPTIHVVPAEEYLHCRHLLLEVTTVLDLLHVRNPRDVAERRRMVDKLNDELLDHRSRSE